MEAPGFFAQNYIVNISLASTDKDQVFSQVPFPYSTNRNYPCTHEKHLKHRVVGEKSLFALHRWSISVRHSVHERDRRGRRVLFDLRVPILR